MEYLELSEYENYEENRVPRTILMDHQDPLALYEREEFRMRYRLRKSSTILLLEEIEPHLSNISCRGLRLPNMVKLLIGLRFYATGSFLRPIADIFHVNQASVSRCVHVVTDALPVVLQQVPSFYSTSLISIVSVKMNVIKLR